MRPTVLSRIPGLKRVPPIRGVALTASLALVVVPGLMLASSSAQASSYHLASRQAAHQPQVTHRQSPDSGPAVHHDTSLPLRVMAAQAHAHAGPAHKRIAPDRGFRLPHPPASHRPDPVVQSRPGTRAAVATIANFDGISVASAGNPCNCAPPDPNAAVGTTQVVEIVNTAFAVYSKTGGTIMGPTATNTLFSGFGGSCQTTDDGDATVAFDRLANRWVIQQFANIRSAAGPYFECVAVSTSADATGTYNRYSFQFTNFPDYPKLSTWPDAYYTTYNMFTPGGGAFVNAEICAMNRANMLTGAAATQQCFTTDASHGGILAADVDGSTPPPAGEPETVMGIGTTSTTLDYWHFHVDWTTPANSTFTGPTDLTVASYSTACGGGTCIPQGGTTQQLDSLGDRIMYRLAYRNFGDHESLVTDQSVTAGSSTGVRWYEFRLSGGNPTVFQQGTYAPDSTFRWMGSIAMDHAGNIALGYSQSSASTHPSIRFTGRAPGDPLGTMTQAETTVFTGGGSQTGGLSRWGDYTSMQVDPSNDCTFWYTNEYIPSNGSFNWNTRLASFQLPGCSSGVGNTVTVNNPGNQSTPRRTFVSLQMTATDSQAGQTFTWSATGLPTGLSINASTGLISGTTGRHTHTFSVTVTATDTTGAQGSASFTWTIT
jgi:Putative Ig domain